MAPSSTTNAAASPTQRLQQAVCQKFGWSCVYRRNDYGDDAGTWTVTVITGVRKDQRFSSTTGEAFDDDKTGERNGKAAVSKMALEGRLRDEIVRMDSLPVQELTHAFASNTTLNLLDSDRAVTWQRFWEHPPKAVGIDTEGNQISPPVLVQVAFGRGDVILETPREALSEDLRRLLRDDSIVKVFCDNFAHKDKRCLGILPDKGRRDSEKEEDGNSRYADPPIVDVEILAMQLLGPVKSPRGLGRLVTLTMPEMQVRIEKPKVARKGTSVKGRFANISRFAMIEQGKAKPLRGLEDLSRKEQTYAALDAWCTLLVYERIKKEMQKGSI